MRKKSEQATKSPGRPRRPASWKPAETERKQAEEELERLASFPRFNPNPVLEINPAGSIVFESRSTTQTLKRIGVQGTGAVFIPQDIAEILSDLKKGREGTYYREIKLGGAFFAENIYLAPKFGTVRIYVTDITERKQAEEALRTSTSFLNSIIEQSPFAMWISDNTGTMIRQNQACRDLLNIRDEEVVGKYNVLQDNIVEEQGFLPLIRNVFEEGKAAKFIIKYDSAQLKHLHLEKTAFVLLEVNIFPIKDAIGRVTNAVIQHIDITERKRAEEFLRALSTRQEAILAAVPDILIEVDKDKFYTWANPAGLAFFGEDVIGKEAAFYFEDEQDTYGVVQPLFNGAENVIYVESWQRRKDGQKRLLAWWCRVLKDESGNVTGALSSARDITEQKQAEEALRDSEERFRAIASNTPDHILMQDRDLRYSFIVNPQLGLTEADMIGKTDRDILKKEEAENLIAIKRKVLETGEPFHLEASLQNLKGETEVFDGSYIPKCDSTGRVDGLIGYFRNITERKRTEEEIHKLNAELEQRVAERTAELQVANKELESFAYSVSHDLKAPLRGIDGYSRLLLEDYDDRLNDEGRSFLNSIRKAAAQMNELIEDLLAYSQLERGRPDRSRVNPGALAQTLVAERDDEIRARGVAIRVNVDCAAVSADPDGLAQAMRNLLDNALKFTRNAPHPAIEIGGRETERACILWVRDNGIGFDMQYHDRIFDIFQMLHRIEDYPGTGIGLAIVRKAMERMGGRAWAESAPGAGATFYLEIPQ